MKRNGFQVMSRLLHLVKPLMGYMIIAIIMGLIGHLCAAFITILGGYAITNILRQGIHANLSVCFALLVLFALARGFLRYAEQACNHFIAFKLLALIRDKVFEALRHLCPAKLEGKDRGDLISIITSDIELLEVFYAHTISPICIAFLFTVIMVLFIGRFHWALGLLAASAYLVVGMIIPLLTSHFSGNDGQRFRSRSGVLSSFVLDSLRGLPEILRRTREDELMDLQSKRQWEKQTVSFMILLYCKHHHGGKQLCSECAKLDAYAKMRSDKCPFMETKTFCSNCPVHCYKTDMREKIRAVMRYSGPRMLFHHPIMAVRHVIETRKEKNRLEKSK